MGTAQPTQWQQQLHLLQQQQAQRASAAPLSTLQQQQVVEPPPSPEGPPPSVAGVTANVILNGLRILVQELGGKLQQLQMLQGVGPAGSALLDVMRHMAELRDQAAQLVQVGGRSAALRGAVC